MKRQALVNLFRSRTQRHGLAFAKVGVTSVECLLKIRACPVTRRHECFTANLSASLGPLITAGLARWNPEAKAYTITPQGETWLTELEIHRLLPQQIMADHAVTEEKGYP